VERGKRPGLKRQEGQQVACLRIAAIKALIVARFRPVAHARQRIYCPL